MTKFEGLLYDLTEYLITFLTEIKDVINFSLTNKRYNQIMTGRDSLSWGEYWIKAVYPELKLFIDNMQHTKVSGLGLISTITKKIEEGELVTKESHLKFGRERIFFLAGKQASIELFNHYVSTLGLSKGYVITFINGLLSPLNDNTIILENRMKIASYMADKYQDAIDSNKYHLYDLNKYLQVIKYAYEVPDVIAIDFSQMNLDDFEMYYHVYFTIKVDGGKNIDESNVHPGQQPIQSWNIIRFYSAILSNNYELASLIIRNFTNFYHLKSLSDGFLCLLDNGANKRQISQALAIIKTHPQYDLDKQSYILEYAAMRSGDSTIFNNIKQCKIDTFFGLVLPNRWLPNDFSLDYSIIKFIPKDLLVNEFYQRILVNTLEKYITENMSFHNDHIGFFLYSLLSEENQNQLRDSFLEGEIKEDLFKMISNEHERNDGLCFLYKLALEYWRY